MRKTITLVTLKTLSRNKNKTTIITTNEKQTKTHETEKKGSGKNNWDANWKKVKKSLAK